MFPHLEAWVRVGRGIPHTKRLRMICHSRWSILLRINALKKTPKQSDWLGVDGEINQRNE
jgi:hypothetical protein